MFYVALFIACDAAVVSAWYLGYRAGRDAERRAYVKFIRATAATPLDRRGGVVIRHVRLQRKPHL